MDLTAIYELDRDEDFRIRVRTAARLAGVENSEAWAVTNTFELAREQAFYSKYSEAKSKENVNPGRDTNYITDEMIIGKVGELIVNGDSGESEKGTQNSDTQDFDVIE